MSYTIGIDLGTTNSVVSALIDDKAEILQNKDSKKSEITPSIVGKINGEIKVGRLPKNNAVREPDKTVAEIKRKMGEETTVNMDGEEYTPQEISAMIIKYLKESAEKDLGDEISEAVITVPSNFNDLQRRATMDAAEIAGLKVERIINEPTAAALAYGLEHYEKEENILVYDLGGGTFDISILEFMGGDIFDVLASGGDNHLGGKDFDELLMDYIKEEFYQEHKINILDNLVARQRLKSAAETAKIELSKNKSTQIYEQAIKDLVNEQGEPINIDIEISRSQFEDLIEEHIEKTGKIIEKVLKEAGITESDIDTVIPVGGSTRIPMVKKLLKNKFGSRVKFKVNPDKIVAKGAAIQAAIKTDSFSGEQPIITDVAPTSLGVEIVTSAGGKLIDGVFDPLIKANDTIPASKKKVYRTLNDNQTTIDVKVFQGEDDLTINNKEIDNFIVKAIPPAPAGEEKIEIEFNYDLNGMLNVNVTILSTGKSYSKKITYKSMNQDEVVNAKERLEENWKKSSMADDVKTMIERAEEEKENLDDDKTEELDKILYNLKKALVEENENKVEEYEDQLTDFLFELM